MSKQRDWLIGIGIAGITIILIFIMMQIISRRQNYDGISLSSRGEKVAVIELFGSIYDSRQFVRQLRQFGKHHSVKSIVFRIESPGGLSAASQEIYEALKKNHMPGGIMAKAGYEHNTSLGGGLKHYIKNGYVPYPIPEGDFGYHQDGASLTMEYAYQDWTLAQLARKLDYNEDYQYFMNRSHNYKNVYDTETTWMRPKDINGKWLADFDPYNYEHGFNESNGAQSTWFVPHDISGLAELMGGKEKAAEKLNEQFETAAKISFTSGNAHDKELHPEYRRIPINYGNQPSMQTAQIFNQLERPDLAQYWTRKVVESAFSGLSPSSGYNGDEDQGLMGSLSVLLKIGLFQMNGGTEENPEYQLGSPIFDKITILLNPDFYSEKTFTIEAKNNSLNNSYVKAVRLNGQSVDNYVITHDDIVNGGSLLLEMTDKARQ